MKLGMRDIFFYRLNKLLRIFCDARASALNDRTKVVVVIIAAHALVIGVIAVSVKAHERDRLVAYRRINAYG